MWRTYTANTGLRSTAAVGNLLHCTTVPCGSKSDRHRSVASKPLLLSSSRKGCCPLLSAYKKPVAQCLQKPAAQGQQVGTVLSSSKEACRSVAAKKLVA